MRERAVRMVFDHQDEHHSQWAAISSIADKFGMTHESLRRWVRRAETDEGLRPGLTTATVQERIGQQIADHLVELLGAHGVAVHLEATHLCTQMRGVREENSSTRTSFWRGTYEEEPGLRDELLRSAGRR